MKKLLHPFCPFSWGIVLLFFFNTAWAQTPQQAKALPLGDASLNGKLTTTIRGMGGYMGECVEVTVTNLTDAPLNVTLEAGRRLVSVESKFQDILIVRSQEIYLSPKGKKVVLGYGFCCEATDGAPIANCRFSLGYMAPDAWQKAVAVMNKHAYSSFQLQCAVWSLSNSYSVYRLGNGDLPAVKELAKALVAANPACDKKEVPFVAPQARVMTAQDSAEWLNRMELSLRDRLNWHPMGLDNVTDYQVTEARINHKWQTANATLVLSGRYIIYTDSTDSRRNIKLLMGEVKRDTLDFGQGRLLVSDICIADRVDILNDKNHYRFTFTHDVANNASSATLTLWNSAAQLLHVRVKPAGR